MPNANTIRQQVSGTIQLTLAPLKGAVILNVPTAFQLNNGAVSGTGGGVVPLSVGVTGLYLGTGRRIRVVAEGTYAGSAHDNLTLTLYEVPASVIAAGAVGGTLFQDFTGWHSLGASSLRAIDSLKGSFHFEAELQLSASGALQGQFTDEIISLVDAWAPTTAVASLTEADLNFVLVATGAATSVSPSTYTLNEFRIDAE